MDPSSQSTDSDEDEVSDLDLFSPKSSQSPESSQSLESSPDKENINEETASPESKATVNDSSSTQKYEMHHGILESIHSKVSDTCIPKKKSDWQQLLENTLFKSRKHLLSYEQHIWYWLQLIITAEKFKKSNATPLLLNCYELAIVTLPIKIFGTDVCWTVFIDSLYSDIITGKITYAEAMPVLEAAEKKFMYSPKHAKIFWNTIMKNEKRLMKKNEIPLDEQHIRIVDMFKKRYSRPYFCMEEDYEEFISWSLAVNLDKDLRLEVQESFFSNVNQSVRVEGSVLEQGGMEDTQHHVKLEEWVDGLCNKYPNLDRIEIICEEIVAQEPNSLCFYWVYLNALANDKFSQNGKRDDKIYDVIQRCYKCGNSACVGMEKRFLEHSLVVASKILSVPKVLELIENAVSLFSITESVAKWHASSRGILIAISNLIHTGQLDSSYFEKYFEKVISPCTMDFFRQSTLPPELTEITRFESKYVDLVTLWVLTQESFFKHDWNQTLQRWTEIFMNNSHPITLMGYIDLVRNRGTLEEIVAAYDFSFQQMWNYERDHASDISTRRCSIKLLQDYLNLVSTTGKVDFQIEMSKQLQKRLSLYTASNSANEFHDLLDSGFNPYDPVDSFEAGLLVSQESADSTLASSSESSLTNKMESLRVGQDLDPVAESETVKYQKGFRVFLSNLSFKATEQDIVEAFKDMGFYPIKVNIKRTAQGKSLGHGYAIFESKEFASYAIEKCDRFKVCGRPTFVSQFKSGPKYSGKEPITGPTLLTILNLPPEWKNRGRIANTLTPYGHIKAVTLDEESSSSSTFTVKVEFYMEDDAQNALIQIKEKNVFQDTNVHARLGFVGKKRQLEDDRNDKTQGSQEKRVKKMKQTKKSQSDSTTSTEDSSPTKIGPQKPSRPIRTPRSRGRGFNPVPTQVRRNKEMPKRTHMKARLCVPVSPQSSSSSEDSPVKKIRMIAEEKRRHESFPESSKSITNNETASQSSSESTSPNSQSPKMEKEPVQNGKPSMSNKDFQNLFKKDNL